MHSCAGSTIALKDWSNRLNSNRFFKFFFITHPKDLREKISRILQSPLKNWFAVGAHSVKVTLQEERSRFFFLVQGKPTPHPSGPRSRRNMIWSFSRKVALAPFPLPSKLHAKFWATTDHPSRRRSLGGIIVLHRAVFSPSEVCTKEFFLRPTKNGKRGDSGEKRWRFQVIRRRW